MADFGEVNSNDEMMGENTDYSDHEERSSLQIASEHHADGKYSNTKVGNNQIRSRGQMSTIGQARAKFWQNDIKSP